MHFKVNSSPCSFHLFGNILWDWLKALSGLAGASQLPNGSAESVAQHLFLLIYWSKGVFTESCALPPFQEKPPVLHSLRSSESSVMGSISHYEQTAKCIWNGKFLIEMGISELPAAGDRMAKQLQRLQSLCRSCLSNNQDSFKYLFETGWFQVLKSTGFSPSLPNWSRVMSAQGGSLQGLAGLCKEGEELGNARVPLEAVFWRPF